MANYAYMRHVCLALIFIAVATWATLLPATLARAQTPDALKQAIEQKTKELEAINNQIRATEAELEATAAKGRSLSNEIQTYDYQIKQISLGIQSSEVKISQLNLEIDSLGYTISDKEHEIELKKRAIASFLRQLQEKDHENTLLIFLKSKSLAESVFESSAIVRLNEGLGAEITLLEDARKELGESLTFASDKRSELSRESTNLKNKRSISEDAKGQRATLLTQTKSQEKLYQAQLSELEKLQAAIGQQIEGIEAELRASFDPNLLPVKRPGVLALPFTSPKPITQKYGATSFAQKAYSSKFHNGVDYGASYGTPVLAARDGIVRAVGNNGKYQYGRYVLIEHDNGLSTLYAHFSKQAAVAGTSVTQGDVIGYIGATGYAFGNHLHFVAYWSDSVILKNLPNCNCGLVPIGVTIDPLDYI